MKQIPAKTIKFCGECPYSHYYIQEGVHFTCGISNCKNKFTHNNNAYMETFLHEDCPLKDAREPGVLVGVSVFLINDKNQILVGERADGSWGLPGGGMDAGETTKEAGKRETLEETSIDICEGDMDFATFTNDDFMYEKDEHWITLYYVCREWTGEAKRVEPHKCKEWRWVDLDNIPKPVFCDWSKNLEKLKALILTRKD